jgi:hypothetical protein
MVQFTLEKVGGALKSLETRSEGLQGQIHGCRFDHHGKSAVTTVALLFCLLVGNIFKLTDEIHAAILSRVEVQVPLCRPWFKLSIFSIIVSGLSTAIL